MDRLPTEIINLILEKLDYATTISIGLTNTRYYVLTENILARDPPSLPGNVHQSVQNPCPGYPKDIHNMNWFRKQALGVLGSEWSSGWKVCKGCYFTDRKKGLKAPCFATSAGERIVD